MESLKLSKKQLFHLQFKYTEIDEIGRKFVNVRRGTYRSKDTKWYEEEDAWNFLIEAHKDKLTEDFLGDFIRQVTWVNTYYICQYYELSEEFMKKYRHYLHWPTIFEHQKLTLSFLDEMSVYLNYLERTRFLPQGLLDEVRKNLEKY